MKKVRIKREVLIKKAKIWKSLHLTEMEYVVFTIREFGGNRTHAAMALGISLRTLRNKMYQAEAAGLEIPPCMSVLY